MKERDGELVRLYSPLLEAAKKYVIVPGRLKLSPNVDKAVATDVEAIHELVVEAVRATFALRSVYEDLLLCKIMSKSFPWKSKKISKAQHLGFVWEQFVNLCYLFEERYKVAGEAINRCHMAFGAEKKLFEKIGEGTKKIKKHLGEQIAARGRHVHESSSHDQLIKEFSIIELADRLSKKKGELGNIDAHYRNVRRVLGSDVQNAAYVVEGFISEFMNRHGEKLTEHVNRFNGIIEQLQAYKKP